MSDTQSKVSIISYKFIRHHPRVNKLGAAVLEQGNDVTIIGLSDQNASLKEKDESTGLTFRLFPKINFRLFLFKIISFPVVLIFNLLSRL